jgi:hypothetical protein
MHTPLLSVLVAAVLLTPACAVESQDDASEESELGRAFRSPLHDRGALPFESKSIHYPEDARPYERATLGVAQTAGESRYVAYHFDAEKGDGLLLSAGKTTESETNGECDDVVRLWLLDSNERIVRTGSYRCEAEYEEPGLQSRSQILRHYLTKGGSYTLVVAVLPARSARPSAPIHTQPWKWVSLDVVRTHKEDQGEDQARCQDGIDIYCRPALRCERARCK